MSAEMEEGDSEQGETDNETVFETMHRDWLDILQPIWYSVMAIESNWQAWLMVDQNRDAKEFPFKSRANHGSPVSSRS